MTDVRGAGDIRFDGRVVVVTGAGNGLGRAHALEFGRRGASVVVNDLGGAVDGTGASTSAADAVVDEIVAAGGRAVPAYESVADPDGGAAIVDTAVRELGRLDVVVNNAGILRNESFGEMTHEQLMGVLGTHLLGSFYVSQPAFRVMREQGYGRFVFTSSGSGLFGLANQANYASAKAGIAGLSSVIALEGAEHGIRSNVIAPTATTRIVAGMRPEDISERDMALAARGDLTLELPGGPEFVTPIVMYLASEGCDVTQQIFSASSGRFARVFTAVTRGWYGPLDEPATAEAVRDHMDEISDRAEYQIPTTVFDESGGIREWFRR
jgi:NAD(P)-dependent dehydrogenase (short-subunit alcohol dehydrogenase family)